jgi:hypothetical protein
VEEEERDKDVIDGMSYEEDTPVKNFWWGNVPELWKRGQKSDCLECWQSYAPTDIFLLMCKYV